MNIMKKFLKLYGIDSAQLLFVLITSLLLLSHSGAAAEPKLTLAPLNEDFVEQSRQDAMMCADNDAEQPLGLLATPVSLKHMDGMGSQIGGHKETVNAGVTVTDLKTGVVLYERNDNKERVATAPTSDSSESSSNVTPAPAPAASLASSSKDAKYDLRDSGRVTPVKNQGGCGSCWCFATMAALESSLLQTDGSDTPNFSEEHLLEHNGFDYKQCDKYSYCIGGQHQMATAYLSRWDGPTLEAAFPYQHGPGPKKPDPEASKETQQHVQEILWLPSRGGNEYYKDNDCIKKAIINYGALYISLHIITSITIPN